MLKELENNPLWKKVEFYSSLQDIFLSASLISATVKISGFTHWFWPVAFLILGVISLIFGAISMKIIRDNFTGKKDNCEKAEEKKP